MRKLLYTLAGLGALAMIASCSKEAESTVAESGGLTATFTVVAPNGVATKAIGDGSQINSLSFAVYDEAGNYLSDLSDNATITGSSSPWTVTVPVVKDMAYQFVFYASSTENSGYSVFAPEDKTITVDYTKLNANDDKADFFYAYDSFTVESSFSKTETLTRPLAQVNFGASDLTEAGYSIKTDETMLTGVTLTGINSVMNVLSQELSGSAEVTLAQAARVQDASPFVTGYDRIGMVYVLAGDSQTSDVTLNVSAQGAENTTEHTITRTIANVPLQGNYRTNILGNIFTNDFVFTVQTEPGFYAPDISVDYVTVNNVTNLNTLLASNKDNDVGQSYIVSTVEDNSGSDAGTSTIIIPAGTLAESLTFQLLAIEDGVINITVVDEESSSLYAKTVMIDVPSGVDLTGITFTVNTPSAHVVVRSSGTVIREVNASTSGSTLVIAAGTSVTKLVVCTGNVEIEEGATVTDIVRSDDNTAEIHVEMAAGAVWTNLASNVSSDSYLFPEHTIASVSDLKVFRDAVNAEDSNTFKGITVLLDSDLDLQNEAWTPIGLDSYYKNFKGVFDGQEHTISNLNVTHAKTAGLFGCMNQGTVCNLVVDGITLTGNHYAGGIVAWIEKGAYDVAIENCTVKNGTITSTPEMVDGSYDNGDKVGGIIGYAYKPTGITDNTVENLTITAYRDLAGVAGYATATTITGNTVKDVNIIQNLANGYKSEVPTTVGTIVGRIGEANTLENNSVENVTISTILTEGIEIDDEGKYVIVSKKGFENFRDLVNASDGAAIFADKTFVLDTDIDLNNEDWTPIGFKADSRSFVGTFDGNDHTITNLYVNVSGAISGGLFGADDGCTIKNLTIDGAEIHTLTSHSASGCAVVLGANQNVATTIENVTVKNAKVYGNRRVSAIAGYFKGTITGCTVEDVEIVASVDELSGTGKYDNGDKTGGVLGYANGVCTITNNTVSDFTITGYRHIGGLAGYVANSTNVQNNSVKDGTLIAYSEFVDVDNHTIGDGTSEIIGKGSTADDTNTFENIRMIINGEETLDCSISDDYKLYKTGGAEFSDDEFEDMSGKIIYEKDGKFILTPKTVAELTSAASEGDELNLYLVNGDSYIIKTGRSSGVITVAIVGISDYDGEKLASVQMDNTADGETHSYRSNYLDMTVKNLVLVGEDDDANGDLRHGAGFCYANSLLVEDCVFTKSQCLWNQSGHTYTIKNSTFECEGIGSKYAMWTRGANSTWNFENCVFNTDGKALKLYSTTGTVNVTGCTFNKVGTAADKNCIEVDCSATITVSGCTNNGYKALVDTSKTNVTVTD